MAAQATEPTSVPVVTETKEPSETTQPAANGTLAYAKLLGDRRLLYYIRSLQVVLGRDLQPDDPRYSPLHIGLGPNRCISRAHASIAFNKDNGEFEFTCLSKNGAYVDGVWVGPNYPPVALPTKSLLQIGDRMMYFLLPKGAPDHAPAGPGRSQIAAALSKQKNLIQSEDGPVGVVVTSATSTSDKKWNRTLREKFRKAFMTWGFQLDKVADDLDDPDIGIDQIEQYALQLTNQVRENCTDATYTDVLEEVVRVADDRGFDLNDVDPSLKEWKSLRKNASKWALRIAMLHGIKNAADKYGPDDILKGCSKVKGRALDPAWGTQEDIDLVNAILKHGFGNFEAIRTDPSLCFCGKWMPRVEDKATADLDEMERDDDADVPEAAAPEETAAEEPKATSSTDVEAPATGEVSDSKHVWPQHLALIGRIKRIYEAIRARDVKNRGSKKRKRQEAQLNTKAEATPKKSKKSVPSSTKTPQTKRETPKAATAERSNQWTHRERMNFQKAMLAFGEAPPWDDFRSAYPSFANKTDESLDSYHASFVAAVQVANGEKADSEKCVYDGRPVSVTAQTAQRIKERGTLMGYLRREVLNHPELEKRLACAGRSYDLPNWWNTQCDKDLVIGALRHGIGATEKIAKDPTLTFASIVGAGNEMPENRMLSKRLKVIKALFGEANLTELQDRMGRRRISSGSSRRTRSAGPAASPTAAKQTESLVKQSTPERRLSLEIEDHYEPPKMPMVIAPHFRILSLGTICDRPKYHTKYTIFPVGFKSEREHASMHTAGAKAMYTSEVLDGGDTPVFRITSAERPDDPVEMNSATAAWHAVDNRCNEIAGRKHKRSSINGIRHFGLALDSVVGHIERMPGADRCVDYMFKKVNVSDAAGLEAKAPEEASEMHVSGALEMNEHVEDETEDEEPSATDQTVKDDDDATDVEMEDA